MRAGAFGTVTGISSEARTSAHEAGGAKLLGLEVIRFTCAMAVLVWHYHHFAMIGDGAAMLPFTGLPAGASVQGSF